ncbi:RluA family pseudouridine synthase, partial [Bradyrhizobium sp. STM 3843]|uniref:RluA family pseudouridine synthase n=1 Tax=Bradyrhizobium sp. STM 3843 TaxID=551947 RepID=UPI00055A9A3D
MSRRIKRTETRSDRPPTRRKSAPARADRPSSDRERSERPNRDRPGSESFKSERAAGPRSETRSDRAPRGERKDRGDEWAPRERPSAKRPSTKRPSAKHPSAKRAVGKPGRYTAERMERPAAAPAARKSEPDAQPLPTKVQTVVVTADENNMRVDRFLEARFPGLSFSHIQRIVRKGELRVDGKRADSKDRLEEGQSVRIPPLKLDAPKERGALSEAERKTLESLKAMTLYEDDDVLVLNKPAGLAVQGGSGMTRHIDQMLEVMRDAKGQKPRLVHRIDRETSGCLLIAKTRFAATHLTGAFRSRSARKIYWALVAGVPKPKQGRISTYLAKDEGEEDTIMRVAAHGDEGASHAVTYYAVVEASATKLAWVSLKPVT